MAFNVQNLNLCSTSLNEAAPAFYTYYSVAATDVSGNTINTGDISAGDTLGAIVSNSNYFGAIAPELTVDDLFYITDGSGDIAGKGFYTVASVDIANKIVNLSPFAGHAGAVSTWATTMPPNGVLSANVGYTITQTTGNVVLTLPPVKSLQVGNTIIIYNKGGAVVTITQNASQTIYFPNGAKTMDGTAGQISTKGTGDTITMVVTYNSLVNAQGVVPIPIPNQDVVYGTDFDLINSVPVLSYV